MCIFTELLRDKLLKCVFFFYFELWFTQYIPKSVGILACWCNNIQFKIYCHLVDLSFLCRFVHCIKLFLHGYFKMRILLEQTNQAEHAAEADKCMRVFQAFFHNYFSTMRLSFWCGWWLPCRPGNRSTWACCAILLTDVMQRESTLYSPSNSLFVMTLVESIYLLLWFCSHVERPMWWVSVAGKAIYALFKATKLPLRRTAILPCRPHE